ncbi:hypothetical protein G9X67_29325 [Rhizobium sp. WYCCWR 11152]|uniref:hypothetical protein n=1 Tax=Rhizobium sp. WYCCWR 11152 TaxID=2692316 RepID=UPI001490B1FB|nr:hypothetical protein [Rhizobium sp. WYCCWR 11152]NNU69358.1 hypothetical protein [Rhizobium sp. WYCCWR 11152]
MAIGIPIPIILPYFFSRHPKHPSDLDLKRKRRGSQAVQTAHGQALMRLSFF